MRTVFWKRCAGFDLKSKSGPTFGLIVKAGSREADVTLMSPLVGGEGAEDPYNGHDGTGLLPDIC